MRVRTSQGESRQMRVHTFTHRFTHQESKQIDGKPLTRTLRRILSLLSPLTLAVVLIVGWFLGSTYGHIDPLFLPALTDVLNSLVNGFTSGLYLENTLVTVQESLLGFLLAILIALPLGYSLVKWRLLATLIQPYLAAWQAIPAIIVAPLLVMWLGYGQAPIIIISMLVVIFPMIISIMLGFQTIERAYLEAARLDGATGWSMLAHIEFPLALPAIVAAVRTGLTLSITGALVGEFVKGPDTGLGALVMIAKSQYDTPAMFATLIVLAVLAALYYGVSSLLGKLSSELS